MISLLLLAALGYVVANVFRAARRKRHPALEDQRHPPLESGTPVQRSVTEELGPRDRSSVAAPNPLAPPPPPPPLSRDDQIAELRRRYVADEITVEEYEAGVDKLLQK